MLLLLFGSLPLFMSNSRATAAAAMSEWDENAKHIRFDKFFNEGNFVAADMIPEDYST